MLNTNFLDYQIFCWLYLHCHLIYLPFKPPTGNGLKFIINLEQVRVTRSKKTYTYANRNCCHEQWTYAGLFRIHHIFSGILLIKYVHQQIQCHLYPMFLNFLLHSRLKFALSDQLALTSRVTRIRLNKTTLELYVHKKRCPLFAPLSRTRKLQSGSHEVLRNSNNTREMQHGLA